MKVVMEGDFKYGNAGQISIVELGWLNLRPELRSYQLVVASSRVKCSSREMRYSRKRRHFT